MAPSWSVSLQGVIILGFSQKFDMRYKLNIMSQEDSVIYEVDISNSQSEDLVVAIACLTPGCSHGMLGLLYTDGVVSNRDLMAKTLDHRVIHGLQNVQADKPSVLSELKNELLEHFNSESHSLGIVFTTDRVPELGSRKGKDPLRNAIENAVGLS